MVGIRKYMMLTEFVLDQERVLRFGMGICDSGMHSGVVLDQERSKRFVIGIYDYGMHAEGGLGRERGCQERACSAMMVVIHAYWICT